MATKTNKAKPNKVCRYCLNELYSHEFVFDETDTFEKIVNETFNLQICQSKTMDRIICIQCVENLHLCAKVKQQILDVQKILMEQYEIFTDIGCESPKQESDSDVFDDYKYDDDIDDSLGDDVKSYMDYIVDEEDGENNCTKEIDIKLPLDEMNETYTTKKRNTLEKGTSKYPRTRKSYLATDAVKHIKRRIKSRKPNKDTPKSATCKITKQTRNAYDSLRSIRNNTLKLLTNSNMCPFISKRTKFACYSCSESYLDIRQLREHSHSHTIEYDLKTDINRCRGMSYKNVDISNLTCRICSDPCTDINSLREHLINKHDITFESAEHFLLPFKLEEGFKCVICDERYFTFNRLSIHMNTHSDRNVCETCGVSYMNRISLRNHINSIHKEKRCSKCPAVFPTSSAKAKHMRIAHNKARSKRYCMRCEMTFTYAHQLKEHMIEKHGEQRLIVECEHCGKKFSAVANLRVHVRSVHIGERNYPCSLCDLRFFTSCDKVRHEKTHGDGKAFSCEFDRKILKGDI